MDYNAIFNAELDCYAKLVYLYFERRSNKEKKCWPSLHRIARDLSISISTSRRAIRQLEEKGFISVEARKRANQGNTSNMYHLI